MNKYEISIWEDFPDKTEQDIPFLNERKICVIGSNTMDSSARAREPKMIENINGTHTFTFKMFYNYIDEYTGEKYSNPFIPYLINERKIKVLWQNEWYDLIIKNIDEDSSSNSVTYTCKDSFITELSKNGYNIELTSDLQNNSGTASELTSMVLDGSGWQFDAEGSTKIYQHKEEVVYEVILSNNLSINKIVLNGNEEEVNLNRGNKVLIFKSSIDQIPDNANNYTIQIHLLYTSNGEDFLTDANEMVVINGVEGYFTGKATLLAGTNRNFKIEVDNINIFEISGDDFSTRYRGKRVVKSQQTAYDKIFERYVNVYKDSSNTTIYGFSSLEFTSPLNIINLIANGSDFTGISGWLGQNLTWAVYPKLNSSTQLDNYNGKGYLRLSNGTYYNSGLTANLAYFTPSQSDLKAGEIGGFNKGEKYIFRIRAKTVGNNTIGNYITSHNSFDFSIKKFNANDKQTPIGNSYFSLKSTVTNDNWLEYTYECINSCSPKQIETLGIYITSNINCWVENVQFFKYAVGTEDDVQKRINPGDSWLQSVSQQIYKYYLPNQTVSSPEEVVFLYKGEVEQSDIYFAQSTYEKITTIEAKASNRFNILQSIAENFECWVQFIIEHDTQGNILLDSQTGLPQKKVRLVEAIGEDLGWSFIYGIDLKNIKRKIISDDIATKVIVLSNNNEFGKNGFCTIARSELNYPKETFILNFDYYINQGLLNRRELELDLYSSSDNYIGYFYNLNKFNNQYDTISNSLSQLNMDLLRQQSDADVLQKQLDATISEKQARESDIIQLSGSSTLEQAKTYAINHEDNGQLNRLIETIGQLNTDISLINNQLSALTNSINSLINKIDNLSSQQESLIENLKQLHERFFQKYSRYIQEGTWQDENYIDDNQYYLDGLQVAYTSSRPQVQYDINVMRLNYLEDYSSKKFKVGDLCYIQDKEFFNYITEDGSPYKLKIVINEITSYFDTPEKDVIKVQNYKTQFDDLFQRIVATTQSLQYVQGSYAKAASVINQDKTLNFNLLQETFDYNTDLVLNASNQDVTWGPDGITIRDNLNSASQLRIMSGGLFVTSDGGLTWKNAIRGDGISTDLLTAGRINVGEIYIYNGDYPTFRWDENGINAYKWNNSGVNFNTFVRYDQYGLYGLINGSQDFVPDNIDDVINNATFGLTWNGFFMKATDGSGSVIINSNNNSVIKCIDGNNNTTFSLNKDGTASFTGMVTATSGFIGGWHIATNTSKALYYGTPGTDGFIILSPLQLAAKITAANVTTDKWRLVIGQNFGVDSNGNLYANGGKIGSFSIASDRLYYNSNNSTEQGEAGEDRFLLCPVGATTKSRSINGNYRSDWRILCGNNFGLTKDGTVYAVNGHFTGTLSAGTITPGVKFGQYIKIDTSQKESSSEQDQQGISFLHTGSSAGLGINYNGIWLRNSNKQYAFLNQEGWTAPSGSDMRLKENIAYDLTNYKNILNELNVFSYTLKASQGHKIRFGVSAQQLHQLLLDNGIKVDNFPFLLLPKEGSTFNPNDASTFYQIDYQFLPPLLLSIIQDQQKEIEQLKTKINEL